MTGTEKQIAYAQDLKAKAVEAFDRDIEILSSEESWYDDPNTEESKAFIAQTKAQRDEIAAYDGDAGKFIDYFKALGSFWGMDRMIVTDMARQCYRNWVRYEAVMKAIRKSDK